ncbi:hypothetical protein C0583_00940 [Candidatus Parcubacteria bacterium]|nr:MAG: hypothetical protein C0583_00940 [Candidatus Parcubacteria bacterium]
MFREIFKNELTVKLFVIVSLLAFFVFSAFLILNIEKGDNTNDEAEEDMNVKYYLNEDYNHKDPYTTKVPNLEDMLRGPIISELDPVLGDINSSVMLVIFTDFECEYCKKQEKIVKELVEDDNVSLMWKDYPANDIDSRSFKAAIAARCAQKEGAFWEYHDELYKSNLSDESFLQIARDLNFDMDDFEDCLVSSEAKQSVVDNIIEADALGIVGIPYMYINDQEVFGETSKEELLQLINIEKEKVKQ